MAFSRNMGTVTEVSYRAMNTYLRNTGLFKMIVAVQLTSGNSLQNSGNNHHLTIPLEGGIIIIIIIIIAVTLYSVGSQFVSGI